MRDEVASPATQLLLQNTRGLFFYGTPQGGSDLANMAVRLIMLSPLRLRWSAAPALKILRTADEGGQSLLTRFAEVRKKADEAWRTEGLLEGRPVRMGVSCSPLHDVLPPSWSKKWLLHGSLITEAPALTILLVAIEVALQKSAIASTRHSGVRAGWKGDL